MIVDIVSSLFLPWSLYMLATLSPGPASLAIMATSAENGRRSGVCLALGVSLGSFFWAICAANGLAVVLNSLAWSLTALKIGGGLYLIWIGCKSIRSSTLPVSLLDVNSQESVSDIKCFVRGILIHLINPKAIFAWLAVITVGLESAADPSGSAALMIVLVCWPFGMCVFLLQALAFSSSPIVFVYRRCKQLVDAVVGITFTFAGFKLMSSSWR